MLLPLVLSVHPSAQGAEAGLAARQALCQAVLERDEHLCQFCGLPAGGWQDVFHVNDDHDDWAESNLAAACPICHASQHIGDTTADQQSRVIWLPELTQSEINVIIRSVHLMLHAGGIPPTLETRPIVGHDDLVCAWRAYRALDRQADVAASIVDTHSPRELASALRALSADEYARRHDLVGGLRLLHRGRSLRRGRDTYPAQLAVWAEQAAESRKASSERPRSRAWPRQGRSLPRPAPLTLAPPI